ncbi:glycosyltransferase family 2 protein [Paratractidigestivibacter sp.]|uniref:glycosyltransferase family 2 protein n=1 Tax=Paratractidigestivibacter sp. TaxID=2847316 RepID=UPI002AC9B762|nr:glycosyltransferase [Paratractidigestivibacter sp.]
MTSIKQGTVSVVVPMYNVAATLEQCLASIESQTYANLQIICMNDGSTDDTARIAGAHAARDARIVVVNKANEGYGATMNRGIAAAEGTWIAIVEPDDYLDTTAFEQLVACAEAVSTSSGKVVDVVRCAYWRVFGEAGGETRAACPYLHRVKPATQPFAVGDGIELLLHHPAIWAGMYRREYLEQAGIRFNEVPGSGWTDNPFLVQTLCGAGVGIAYVDEPLYYYREHDFNDAEALAKKSPLTPLTRWNEMMDAACALGVDDDHVLDALALRGVNYATITVSAAGMEADGVHDLVERSMERLDPARVFAIPALSGNAKAMFAQVRGIEVPAENKAARVRYLAREAAYRVRVNGLGFVAQNVKRRLNRL